MVQHLCDAPKTQPCVMGHRMLITTYVMPSKHHIVLWEMDSATYLCDALYAAVCIMGHQLHSSTYMMLSNKVPALWECNTEDSRACHVQRSYCVSLLWNTDNTEYHVT